MAVTVIVIGCGWHAKNCGSNRCDSGSSTLALLGWSVVAVIMVASSMMVVIQLFYY